MNINEEQRPLTTADIRALLDEQEERINAKHKEEIRRQSDEQDARHKEEIRVQEERINAAHQEEIRALLDDQEERISAAHREEMRAHQEEMRLLEEATDKRFKDLEQQASASASASPPQDTAKKTAGATQNDEILPLTDNPRSSNTQLAPNRPRGGNTGSLSFLLFRKERNEGSSGDNDGAGDDRIEVLEEDTFSMMMLNKPFREIPSFHPTLLMIIFMAGLLGTISLFSGMLYIGNGTLWWSLLAIFAVMIFGPLSCPWILSFFTFLWLQLALGIFIILDQTFIQPEDSLGSYPGLTLAQYLTVFFALVMQNDIFSSLQTLGKLKNTDNVPWDDVIGQPGNRTWGLWICRILLPNIFKFIQAVVTLYATFVVIIQSTSVVDLLKDFTSLLVLSQADNIMFHFTNQGFFGEYLKKKTEEVKAVQWMIVEDAKEEGGTDEDGDEDDKPHCWRSFCSMGRCFFVTLAMVMIGVLTYFVVGQYNDKILKSKYPECDVVSPSLIGDGFCHDFSPYNTAECGWDGGDCPEPSVVTVYNSTGECNVTNPTWLGDGWCDNFAPYNTTECSYDGGDCL